MGGFFEHPMASTHPFGASKSKGRVSESLGRPQAASTGRHPCGDNLNNPRGPGVGQHSAATRDCDRERTSRWVVLHNWGSSGGGSHATTAHKL